MAETVASECVSGAHRADVAIPSPCSRALRHPRRPDGPGRRARDAEAPWRWPGPAARRRPWTRRSPGSILNRPVGRRPPLVPKRLNRHADIGHRWTEERPHTLVVACSDGRLQEATDTFLGRELGLTQFDRFYMPG